MSKKKIRLIKRKKIIERRYFFFFGFSYNFSYREIM